MDPRARAVELHAQLEPFDCDRDDVCAGARRLHLHALEHTPFERAERLTDLLRTVGERAAAGEPAERLQRRLLALRSVDTADPAGGEAELDQLLECLRLVVVELTALDRRDEIGQPAATLLVLDEREHGLRLAEGDLGRVAAQRDQ
jgi:hypothetical protein